MNNKGIYFYVFIAILLYFVFFIKFKSNTNINESNSKTRTRRFSNKELCTDCKVWNNRDARAKCDSHCMQKYPDKDVRFNGNWKNINNNLECECEYTAKLKNLYVGCPLKENINENIKQNDCYITNETEANEKCPMICNKYANQHSLWSGKWKNTSSETSACECQFYE